MFSLVSSLAVLLLASSSVNALNIGGDLSCTTYNGSTFVYTAGAVNCQNAIGDEACASRYPTSTPITSGTDVQRPLSCYSTSTATPAPLNEDMKSFAIRNCAKSCGYCCETSAYSCKNAEYPRYPCNSVTRSQCLSSEWREILEVDCPAACGLCDSRGGSSGCFDAVRDCDKSICNTNGLQDFVNKYCQRTCGRCPSTTVAGTGTGTGTTCTSYDADSSTNCANWANNGFCTNTFYTPAQRKAKCATTCKVC